MYGLFAIALALATLLHPLTAYAQEGDLQDTDSDFFGDPERDAVALYAKSLDLSYEEALRRLEIQNQFGFLVGELYEQDPTYGGGWIEHAPEFRLGVHFSSSNGEERLREYAEKYDFVDQIHVKQSPYSFKELEKIASILAGVEELQDRFVPLVGMSMREAKVIVLVEEPEEFKHALQAHIEDIATAVGESDSERIGQIVHVEYGSQPVSTSWPNYYGGNSAIYSGNNRCSAGLAMKKDGNRYASTALHCFNANNAPFMLDGHALGNVKAFRDDVVILDAQPAGWTITNRIRENSTYLAERIVGHKKSSQLPDGTYVSHRGTSSRFAMITITGRSDTGPPAYTVINIWGTVPSWLWPPGRPAVCGGDSGGAVFQVVGGPPIADAIGAGIESWGSHTSDVPPPNYPWENCAPDHIWNTMGFKPVDIFPTDYIPLDTP